jgi:DNA-binding GntR family transcriptional regulator
VVPLPLPRLADEFKVSATPVRETLYRLTGEQLLISLPHKGFFAKILDLEEMNELSVLTNVLLKHAITVQSAAFDLLKGSSMELPHVDESRHLYLLSVERLFETVASLSNNRTLVSTIRNFNDRTHYVHSIDLEDEAHRIEMNEQIKDFINQLRKRNLPAALDILEKQLRRTLAVMPALVKEGIVRSYDSPAPSPFRDHRFELSAYASA